ncbi:MAG: ABC transporter ATP-binding protein [Acidobacteria bacterium]|nr:MAG: ABC transporter ATP-binding protein [Acidobacteriota bacterium]
MRKEVLRALLPYLRRYRGRLVGGMAILLVNTAVLVSIPYIIDLAINDLGNGLTVSKLLKYCLLLMVAVSARAVLNYFQRLILITISRLIELDLRNDLLAQLERLSSNFFQKFRTGDLMARAVNDLMAVRNMVGPGIMYSAQAVVLFVYVITILWHLDPILTLIAFIPAPFVSLAVQWFGKRIHDRFERIQSMFSTLSTRVEENLAGLRLVRAYAREHIEEEKFDRLNHDYVARNMRLVLLTGSFDPLLQFMLGVAFVLVLWFGGRAVLEHRITIGGYAAFNLYMAQMAFPMIALGYVINLVQRGTASLARLQEVLEQKPDIADTPETNRHITTVHGDIEFRDLTFSYGVTSAPVLRNLNLHIPAGSTVALVGATGSGKSTLVGLIPRLLDAPSGMVLIDGRPIREIPLALLRRSIGWVPQETFLFSDTLRANIAFGRPGASEEEVRKAADIAGLSQDVVDFSNGFDTLVGERGLTLSGGQKQRTALARAVLRQAPILILDDALASVDTITEEKILEGLENIAFHTGGQRTTLLISHRISTVRNADFIAVLDQGAIAEKGTHAELIGLGGLYANLYEKQLLEEELARVD